MIDELLKLSPTISDPQEVAAGNRNRPSDADLRPLEPFPQAPQSRDSPAADPGPVNPEDNRRLSVYPHVEVESTADVCPSGPARTRSIRAETAGSSGLALGPNQRGKAGGEVEASIPVMAMARQRTRRRVRRRTHPPRRGSIVPRMCRTVAPQPGVRGRLFLNFKLQGGACSKSVQPFVCHAESTQVALDRAMPRPEDFEKRLDPGSRRLQ